MTRRFYLVALVGALVSGCSRAPVQPERQHAEPQPASSWVPPGTCLPEAVASLQGLSGKTNAELEKLANHYFSCVDDQELSSAGRIAAMEELAQRGDARAAGGLAAILKYQPNPDRERSLHWAREALRRGDPRGRDILAEWALKEQRDAAIGGGPAPR